MLCHKGYDKTKHPRNLEMVFSIIVGDREGRGRTVTVDPAFFCLLCVLFGIGQFFFGGVVCVFFFVLGCCCMLLLLCRFSGFSCRKLSPHPPLPFFPFPFLSFFSLSSQMFGGNAFRSKIPNKIERRQSYPHPLTPAPRGHRKTFFGISTPGSGLWGVNQDAWHAITVPA